MVSNGSAEPQPAAAFIEIDGFRCYAPELARDHTDYPSDGFDVTAAVEASSFWCRSRNRVLRDVVERFTDPSRPLAILCSNHEPCSPRCR